MDMIEVSLTIDEAMRVNDAMLQKIRKSNSALNNDKRMAVVLKLAKAFAKVEKSKPSPAQLLNLIGLDREGHSLKKKYPPFREGQVVNINSLYDKHHGKSAVVMDVVRNVLDLKHKFTIWVRVHETCQDTEYWPEQLLKVKRRRS